MKFRWLVNADLICWTNWRDARLNWRPRKQSPWNWSENSRWEWSPTDFPTSKYHLTCNQYDYCFVQSYIELPDPEIKFSCQNEEEMDDNGQIVRGVFAIRQRLSVILQGGQALITFEEQRGMYDLLPLETKFNFNLMKLKWLFLVGMGSKQYLFYNI